MIVITLAPQRNLTDYERERDALRREWIGYAGAMSDDELYHRNHGMWVISEERASSERYALFVARDDRRPDSDYVGRLAVEIERIEKLWHPIKNAERSLIHGRILAQGDPIYDAYVGKTSPLEPQRNPVRYFEVPEDEPESVLAWQCKCGCGEIARGRPFKPGHDQTALHNRVRKIGTVEEFLDWFDSLERPFQSARNVRDL